MSGLVDRRAGALLGRHQRAFAEPLRSFDRRQSRDADAIVDRLLRVAQARRLRRRVARRHLARRSPTARSSARSPPRRFDPAHHRFNDGRCDPQGRFFAGTMNEKRDAPSAALYRIDSDFRVTEVLGNLTISNGLAWSPDGRTMYHADTPTLTINAFAFDAATGTPSNGRVRSLRRANRPPGRRRGRQRRLLLDRVLSRRPRRAPLACRRRARVLPGPRDVPDDVRLRRRQPADALCNERAPAAR